VKPLDPRVLPYLQPARYALAVVMASAIMSGIATIAQAFALGTLVVELLADPGGSNWHAPLWWLLVATAIRGISSAASDLAASHAAGQVSVNLRRLLVVHALKERDSTDGSDSVGARSLLATRGVAATEPYFTSYLPTLVLALALPPLTLVAIGSQDLLSAVIVICTLPLIPVFAILIGLATKEKSDRQWKALSQLAGYFLDVVKGLPTLIVYRRARTQSRRVREITDSYRRSTLETLKIAFISSAALELIATISVALVAVTVGLRLAHGTMDFTTALIVLLLAPEAYWPLRRVGAEFHAAAEGTSTFAQIHELLNNSSNTETTELASAPRGEHPIVLEGVRLGYGDKLILDDLSATIPSKGLTTITGPSGCGKTTLLSALTGELPIQDGGLSLGGMRLSDPAWTHQVAYMGQRPWIQTGTIEENVRIGNPTASPNEIHDALRRVDLALPLDTQVGEDGHLLSAGQRARLALARVVISPRRWVILDEPTAHLDDATEELLLTTLKELARDRAVITVAHRPAVVEAADVVIPLPAREPVRSTPLPQIPAPVRREPARAASEPSPHRRGQEALGSFLSVMAATFGVALTATAGWLIARAAEQPPILYLMVAIVSVRMFGLGRPAWRYVERLVTHDDALRKLAEYRASVYDLLIPLTPARLGRHRGDLLTSIVDDVDSLVDERLRVRQPLITWFGTTALAAAVAALIWPPAGGWIAVTSLLGGALIWWLAKLSAIRNEPASVSARAQLSAVIVESLSHSRDLVLWQRDAAAVSELDAIGGRGAAAAERAAAGLTVARALALLIGALGTLAVAFSASSALSNQEFSGPMMALLLLLPIALVDVLSPLADAGGLSVRTKAARERVEALATVTPAVTDPDVPRSIEAPADITLSGISTGWTKTAVIEDIDVNLPLGRHLGVVGPSGCGKSTLAALLLRFLPALRGSYLLGGVEVSDLTGDEVRRHIGLVDDDPHIFSSNVVENIRLARPDASDAEVIAALQAAHLSNWISELPAGLDTRIGEGALQVSGGERARIGLARAILSDPPVLVLDEPTAHLDSATAREVTADLLQASQGRSLVWITHTDVGLDQMDEVLEIADGSPRTVESEEPELIRLR
jgi:ATP-binding cassette subfamily C protein CydCD